MPSIYQSRVALNKSPAKVAHGAELVVQRSVVTLNAALVINDILELGVLPADHALVDAILDTDDIDSGTLLVYDVGIMSGSVGLADTARTVGAQIFSAANTPGRTAGMARPTLNLGNILPSSVDRSIGLKATTAPAGFSAQTAPTRNAGVWTPATVFASGDGVVLPSGVRARCSTAGTSGTDFPFTGQVAPGSTVSDGSAVWTIVDAQVALTLFYRAARNGF